MAKRYLRPIRGTLVAAVAHDLQISGVVWPESKQQKLIDSIFTHYPIPPIVLALIGDPDDENFVCVDGKQVRS